VTLVQVLSLTNTTGLGNVKASKVVLHGIAWTSFSQVCQTLFSFLAMLLLVRIIPPAEYGRAAAIVGFLTVLNIVNCRVFIRSALQLPGNVEADWSMHWSAALYIQALLMLACNGVAGVFWLLPHYRPLAPLMHLASLGILFDVANQLGVTMLERQMNFRRLRILYTIASLTSVAVAVALGLARTGAYAIVVSGNVVAGLPFAVDLLLVRRWRPRPGWWRIPNWRDYRQSLRFGLFQSASGSLWVARGALESILLVPTVGFTAMGLWSRGQALFTAGAGKITAAMTENVYPLLPRFAGDRENYPRQATLYVQVMFWFLIPAACYMGLIGPTLSRVVYGKKWIAADPLIWPGALLGMALSGYGVVGSVLLAANRLRTCFRLDVFCACVTLPTIGMALASKSIHGYAWAVAGGQMLAAAVALITASTLFTADWKKTIILPPLLGAAGGCSGVWLLSRMIEGLPAILRLVIATAVYMLVFAFILRIVFRDKLKRMLLRVPGGGRIHQWIYPQRQAVAAQA